MSKIRNIHEPTCAFTIKKGDYTRSAVKILLFVSVTRNAAPSFVDSISVCLVSKTN